MFSKVTLVLLGLAALAAARGREQAKLKSTEINFDGQERIVGGIPAQPYAWPWQVALFLDNNRFCGGTIISHDWIVTAAHCLDGASYVEVLAGAHDILNPEPSQARFNSTELIIHESWSPLALIHDIGLIRIEPAIIYTPEIAPACLPRRGDPDVPASVYVVATGWGYQSDAAITLSPILNEVTVPTIPNEVCIQVYGNAVTPEILCTSSDGGQGTCEGDAGGPLHFDNGGGVLCVHGISSFGSRTGCEEGYPDGFTRVNRYIEWLETNTGLVFP